MIFWTLFLAGAALLVFISIKIAIKRSDAQDRQVILDSMLKRVAADPMNVGAHELLGDALWRAGRYEEARAAYETAIAVASDQTPTEQTKYRLRLLEIDRQERDGTAPVLRRDVICPQCGALSPPDARTCHACHYALPAATISEAMRLPEVAQSARESLAIMLVLALCFHVVTMLPIEVKGCVIMATAIVCGWRFLRALEGRRG